MRDLCIEKGIYWNDTIDKGVAELTVLALKDKMPRVDKVALSEQGEIEMSRWGSRQTRDQFEHNFVHMPDKDLGKVPINESIQHMQTQEEINEYERQMELMEQQNQQVQSQSRGRTM